jgi:hypothetical protein
MGTGGTVEFPVKGFACPLHMCCEIAENALKSADFEQMGLN